MRMTHTDNQPALAVQEREWAEPANIKHLIDTLDEVVRDAGTAYHSRLRMAQEIEWCDWEGQSNDGRKWAEKLGREPFPWQGCHDLRIRLAQEVVDETVDRLKNGWMRAELSAVAHGSQSTDRAAVASKTMRWVTGTLMQPDLGMQIGLAAYWRQTGGAAIWHVGWERCAQLEEQELTLEMLLQEAVQAQMARIQEEGPEMAQDPEVQAQLLQDAIGSVEQFRESLSDPVQLEGMVESMRATLMPHLTEAQVQAVLEDVRDKGRATYPVERAYLSRPKVTALRPMVDVFFPLSTLDVTRAPWVTWVTYYSRDQVEERVRTDGWSAKWVDKAWPHHGKEWDTTIQDIREALDEPGSEGVPRGTHAGQNMPEREELLQVMHHYHRAVDRRGMVHVRETVYCPEVPELAAVDRALPYRHGMMPFVGTRRETKARGIITSRGIPEVIMTHQQEIKHHRDRRADRADLLTLPPIKVPGDRGGGRYPFRPGSQIPMRRGLSPEAMVFPPMDPAVLEIEARIREDVDRLMGRWSATVPEPVTIEKQQAEMNEWLADCGTLGRQIWALCQQYLDPVQVSAVQGGDAQETLEVSREEIQGQYAFLWRCDVRDANLEFVTERLGLINTLMGIDNAGVIDRPEVLAWAFRSIDPYLASRALRPAAAQNQRERAEEQAALAQMMVGLEPDLIEGQDHATRLMVLQEAMQSNPIVAQAAQENELFRALLENRVKHHSFMVEQQQNAVIGRVGTGRVMG